MWDTDLDTKCVVLNTSLVTANEYKFLYDWIQLVVGGY